MATMDAKSAYPKLRSNADYGTEMVSNQSPRMTSVNAHTALTVVVSLSVIEMERLIETFGVADVNLDDTARVLQREFADAVRALR